MTNLRKCHSISMFAVIALAFVCLVVGQATVAKVEKASVNENADKSFETSVPLPAMHSGASGAASSVGDPTSRDLLNDEGVLEGFPWKLKYGEPSVADGIPKGLGDDFSDPFIIGDQTVLPFTGYGDVSTGTDEVNFWTTIGYAGDYCDLYGYCGPDQFWKFSPTVDCRVDILTCNGADVDLGMLVYEDDGSGPSLLTGNDDACGAGGFMPAVYGLRLTGGNDYIIMIDQAWGGGAYQLDVLTYVSTATDVITPICATATQHEVELCGERINGGCYGNFPDLTVTNTTAEVITGDFCAQTLCGTLDLNRFIDPANTTGAIRSGIERDADQWLFTVTEPIIMNFTLISEINTAIFLHYEPSGACASQVNLGNFAVNAFVQGGTSVIMYPGVHTFSIRANAEPATCAQGDFGEPRYVIETSCTQLVDFDVCPKALEISGDTEPGTPIVQDLCGLTDDGTIAPGYYMEQNGWFLWTCEESGEYTFSACNTPNLATEGSYDLFMGAWDASLGCAGVNYTNNLAANDDSPNCPGYEPEITFIAAEGLDYLISVGGWAYQTECGDLWLEISHEPIPLIADNCLDGPIQLTGDMFHAFFNNLNATPDGPDPSTCNAGSFGGDIWFEVTAWETGYAFASFCDVNFDGNMEVYEGGDCPSNTNYKDAIRCNDDGCSEDTNPWPQQHGSYASFPVVTGEHYILRVGGWYSPPDYPLTLGGMGFGWYEFFIVADPAGTSPVNDYCVDVTPVALVDGVADERTGNTFYMTRNDLDCDVDRFPPNLEPNVWEAFSVPSGVCMDVAADFFGTVDPHEGNGTRYGADPGEAVAWTGCACEGDFVGVASTIGCLQPNECVVTGGDFNNYHAWEMMPAGDYWFALNHTTAGTMGYQFDYVMHFTGTVITCEYCVAGANIGSCGVSGGSWINAVRLQEINNSATGCHGYEDRTAETASVYKGMPYTLAFDMGKVGLPTYAYDRAYVWIDWNQNSVFFDGGESYIPTRLAYEWTMPFTVPLDAVDPGAGASMETRMRIRLGSTSNTSNAYCGTGATFGEVEDYVILAVDLECGDFDMSGTLDADDIAFLQAWYFGGGTAPDYWQRADIDGDGMVTLADLIALVDAAYNSGPTNCM